jgi:predicted RNase H-like nuclease (RuvC/YqgF family)
MSHSALNKVMAEEVASAFISSRLNNDFQTEMIRLETRLKEQVEILRGNIVNDFKVLSDKWESATKREDELRRKLTNTDNDKKRLEITIERQKNEIATLKKTVDFQKQRLLLSEKAVHSQDAAERKKVWKEESFPLRLRLRRLPLHLHPSATSFLLPPLFFLPPSFSSSLNSILSHLSKVPSE